MTYCDVIFLTNLSYPFVIAKYKLQRWPAVITIGESNKSAQT